MPCPNDQHEWRDTGKTGIHIEWTKGQIKRTVFAFYDRCAKCGQMGYRRNRPARLRYTWPKDQSQWLTA